MDESKPMEVVPEGTSEPEVKPLKAKPSVSVIMGFTILGLATMVVLIYPKLQVSEGIVYAYFALLMGLGASFDIVNLKHTALKLGSSGTETTK